MYINITVAITVIIDYQIIFIIFHNYHHLYYFIMQRVNKVSRVSKVVQLVQTIEKNPHFQKQDCEYPNCIGSIHMIKIIHPLYLYIIDRQGNIKDPLESIWSSCKECGKAMFLCGTYCQEQMGDNCYSCQKCQIRQCHNKYYDKCTICDWKKCKGHLIPCIYCSELICKNTGKNKNSKCQIADTGICKRCWCMKCNNPLRDSCFCQQCHKYHNHCTC